MRSAEDHSTYHRDSMTGSHERPPSPLDQAMALAREREAIEHVVAKNFDLVSEVYRHYGAAESGARTTSILASSSISCTRRDWSSSERTTLRRSASTLACSRRRRASRRGSNFHATTPTSLCG